MTETENESTRRRRIRNQAIERALMSHFRGALAGYVEVSAVCTYLDGIKVQLTTSHDTQPIADLTITVRRVVANTKINMLGAKLNEVAVEQLYLSDINSFDDAA